MRFSLVLLFFAFFFFQFFTVATFAENSKDAATSALSSAEGAVASAYQAVLKAESAGGNVTDLLVQLNQAGEYLARAQIEYGLGEFEKAAVSANSSKGIGEEVQNAAVELQNSAANAKLQHIMVTMLASIVGMALIALGSFWVWFLLKKRYGNKNAKG